MSQVCVRFYSNDAALVLENDFLERFGGSCLGLLQTAFGYTVLVEKISGEKNLRFTEIPASTTEKIVAIAASILLLPVTIALSIIGSIALLCSTNHTKLFEAYQQRMPVQPLQNPPRTQAAKKAPIPKLLSKEKAAAVDSLVAESFPQEQTRKYPNAMAQSTHEPAEFFQDADIVEKSPLVKKIEVAKGFFAYTTRHNKPIIQQQATHGYTAAAAAMLIADHGKPIHLQTLQWRNSADDDDLLVDITQAGLAGTINQAKDLEELRTLLLTHGSAIVSGHKDLSDHVVVVDHVANDLSHVRLRDPYHGWEITVTAQAFQEHWQGGKAIQVASSSGM